MLSFKLFRYLVLVFVLCAGSAQAQPNAETIIRATVDNWRGLTSVGEVTMTIHRRDWERSMSMKAWTQGDDQSLVRVTAPAKDAGNATLIDGDDMWSYAPRINRVIKIPSSMMAQSWMGSDFSNKDITKSTDVLDNYTHVLIDQGEHEGITTYVIESTPHEDAPVVWGKEVYTIRADYVILRQEFWSQDGELVKYMVSSDIVEMDGRKVAARIRMQPADNDDEWTEIVQQSIEFDVALSGSTFTQANLRNPRQ
ncbi:outer membrane lipoprotein-sorting protein [Umboniibacter marinipuniceus]|uniref:Outer membrane lipoprotein-sorting protein n=1 Tax=Umboniibacter marinipuniceus TaxID=569599 RepID=A0A3M0A1Q9_9GAMM|nr:outer membrane lipoprotein-sorting protein [Umboniibacter marinipuniceus]RMA78740.1 outer membrane lipoprotein-sorting protein [Umboniibacter marinipuniceus]